MSAFIRPSFIEDAGLMLPRIRKADLAEIDAAVGIHPLEALRHGFDNSLQPMTVEFRDRPVAMMGVVPGSSSSGRIWMLGTDDISIFRYRFLRYSKPLVEHICRPFSFVHNHVDARNHVHIQWLRWLDFRLMPAKAFGVQGLPFHEFYKVTS